MVSFLLIISFLLHLITLAAIFQLVKKIQASESDTASDEIVQALERSLAEIKEENNRLQALLDHKEPLIDKKKNESKIKKESTSEKQMVSVKNEKTNGDIDRLLGTDAGYKVEASLESRVLQLYAAGKNVEEIAKTLNCGKTEAELIIKLYNQ